MKERADARRAAVNGRDTGARERLLAATARLVAGGGTAAATSRAIAEAAGENLGSITYWFGSKDALVAEALVLQARSLIDPVMGELTSDQPQVDKLLRAVQMLTTLFAERRSELPAYLDCLAAAGHHDRVATELRALLAELRSRLAEEMRAQQAAGLIPGWVQPEAMAELLVAVVNGTAAGAVADPEGSDPIAVAGQFVRLLLAAGRS